MISQHAKQTRVEAIPIGENSKNIFTRKRHVLIGASPFNSYFSEENLIKIITWSLDNFNEISVFIPDKISIFTLMARGYTSERAEAKTRRQDTYLKNKIFRAFKQVGFTEGNAAKMVVSLSELSNNLDYENIYQECLKKFDADLDFKLGCFSTCSWILNNKQDSKILIDKNTETAVQYFLREFPLFLDTPRILGADSSLFAYHSVPAYLKTLYESKMLVAPNQGFLRLNITEF
jgi:cyclo(L-tyrosyl-L-tyrosyl) synthase